MIVTHSTLSQWNHAVDWFSKIMGETGDTLNKEVIGPTLFQVLGSLKNKTLLDVGCGSGYLSAELANTAKQVVATDFSSEFIDLCKKKYRNKSNLVFRLQDITKEFQFKDQSFDIVLAKMVLQYVKDLHNFAEESARVIKKRGRVIVVVDHPFHRQFYYAQSLAGKRGLSFDNLDNYFSRSPQTKTKLTSTREKIELTWYPKTLEDYIRPFIKVGLTLTDLREVGEHKESTIIPRILFFEFSAV